ncbi:glycosyltransferase family 2 protein [Tepidibacter formicigenes]|jgi:GT2 family glycosyltransferase|uniref:Glycosyltransferase, GT2 family n=1 Tax=Tepidibacter formicigenes DSM 15518 TaxID=1123349 RepID=A0A1M6QVH2_9FIRM|nr:glycosyltransferase family 2 protein [Tepidibacter formicigenes]SHK24259.1 Glycosyltransferase, GT2 family [Tepidibacter formicigenes DSM 15518]
MKISLVIPNYNGKKFLKDCLDSLSKQSFSYKYEIIMVDNNSSDDSVEYIKENYSYIKLIYLNKNHGFAKAVNEGIKLARGEYVVLLNNDTEVEEDWLKNLVTCIEKDENVFSVSSKMVQYNHRNLIDDAGDEYTLLGWTLKTGDGENINRYNKKREIFSSCAGAAIYRKKIFDKIGYFDENFFAYMEDVDISYRAKIYGYKNIYCPDAIVYHIGSGTSGSRYNEFKVKLAARNNIYVPYKNMSLLQLITNFPFLLLGFFIKYLFFVKKGFGKVYLDGLKEGFTTLNKIEKVKYKNKNLFNYIKIELELIKNTFKYIFSKIIK